MVHVRTTEGCQNSSCRAWRPHARLHTWPAASPAMLGQADHKWLLCLILSIYAAAKNVQLAQRGGQMLQACQSSPNLTSSRRSRRDRPATAAELKGGCCSQDTPKLAASRHSSCEGQVCSRAEDHHGKGGTRLVCMEP